MAGGPVGFQRPSPEKYTAMVRGILKKHWFTIALLLIVLIAIARRNLRFETVETPALTEPANTEKYTDNRSASRGAALLQLAGDATNARVSMPVVDESTAVAFLQRFGRVAVAEQEKFGIPASVLLACAYVNSFAGQRACAVEANNYLALRCAASWDGPTAVCSGACFRKYNSAWESIRDFNFYLIRCDWYPGLKEKAGKDWRAWVKGLAANQMSDVEHAGAEMERVIEAYRLFELD
ncbi:MAG: hypothetical protein EP344_17095 [Bacteroidetes bacterium]|nr:MAG: hypothetical protein EP344_17095 [Bacteroidota bacterium]